MAKSTNNKRERDAKTGQFVKISETKRRPNSTVVETIKKKKK